MEQFRVFSDGRLVNGCLYCGGPEESRDHVPSRVFLDAPYPPNLPVVWACISCNNGFSLDESYVACLIETVLEGSTDPNKINRKKIIDILNRTPDLRSRLESAKTVIDGQAQFAVETERMKNVMLKLARGHAAFELSQVRRNAPTAFWCRPLSLLTEEEREEFEAPHFIDTLGEVGSRGMQRTLVTQIALETLDGNQSTLNLAINDWLEVQEGRYRYIAIDEGTEITIKIVVAEYLACEVVWTP